MKGNKTSWPGWETTRLIGRSSFGAVYAHKSTLKWEVWEFIAVKTIRSML